MTENFKKDGVIYTPIELGEYMARKMFDSFKGDFSKDKVYSIVDPSCGTGDLLEAAVNVATEKGISVKVIGFDIDEEVVSIAKEKFCDRGIDCNFFVDDFLSFSLSNGYEGTLLDGNRITYDFIISNPPYIRTQHLGEEYSKQLSKQFGLKGKIDIYQAFYSAYPSVMHENSIMSVITSNKFISNKTGKSLRKLLHEKFYLEEVIDLGDSKVFDAAVLPAILVGRLNDEFQKETKFYSLYEARLDKGTLLSEGKSIFYVINKELTGEYVIGKQGYIGKKGVIVFPRDYGEPWVLSSSEDLEWANKLEQFFSFKVKDFGKVRVGIKTTADNVFLNPDFDNYSIESDLIHPIFNSKAASRWKVTNDINELPRILYPMKAGDGKRKAEPVDLSQFPIAKSYLESYFEQLDGRQYIKKAKRQWYEIWVPQDPKLWSKPKLVSKANFIFDNDGLYVDGNCYWFVEKKNNIDILFLILGVCNSNVLKRYHEIKFQNKLYSNKYRYISQYIEEYPVPDLNLDESKKIINIVKELVIEGGNPIKEKEIDDLLEKIIETNKR